MAVRKKKKATKSKSKKKAKKSAALKKKTGARRVSKATKKKAKAKKAAPKKKAAAKKKPAPKKRAAPKPAPQNEACAARRPRRLHLKHRRRRRPPRSRAPSSIARSARRAETAARMTTRPKKKKAAKKTKKRAAKTAVKKRAVKAARKKSKKKEGCREARCARAPSPQNRKPRLRASRQSVPRDASFQRSSRPGGGIRRLRHAGRRAAASQRAPERSSRSPTRRAFRASSIKGKLGARYTEILTPAALRFLAELHREFEAARERLLAARAEQQALYDAGEKPDFRPGTKVIRDDADWRVAPIPQDLLDRRVEITGPVDRKMIVNALNCGAHVYMADFEDANSPTWANNLEGQINLKDRWAGKIDFTDKDRGKRYALGEKPAVLIVRPRGWHLVEEHVTVDNEPISASLFDFGLYFFHNAQAQIAAGTGPYFYLPKLETHEEARLWNEVFVFAQERLGIPNGTIRATVLIETLPAAFEMEEILYELRDHIAGLERRALGLHLLVHQEARQAQGLHPAGPLAGGDGRSIPRRLCGAAGEDLPLARRVRDGRHGGANPDQERSRGERRGVRESARRQGARGARRLRRHMGRASGPRAGRARGVRPHAAGAETSLAACASTCACCARTC